LSDEDSDFMESLKKKLTPNKHIVEARKNLFDGFLTVHSLRIRHQLFEGGWTQSLIREVLLRPRAVGVLLYDPDCDCVVLVRQFRVGVIDQTQSPWLLELVAGLANEGEEIADVAVREVFEESGIKLKDHEIVADYFNSPGISDERTTIFCGKVDSRKAGGIFGVDSENEDISVEVVSLETALKFLISGEINNAMTIIALQWLALNKKELSARWA